jgi:meiotically up-regulated gene 157 (Mug157) protein
MDSEQSMTTGPGLSRRHFVSTASAFIASSALVPNSVFAQAKFASKRPVPAARRFRSKAVDATIESVAAKMRDPELAWLFSNCLPNTLDTTVTFKNRPGGPDTIVVTGDIPAMWLRDSSAQVWPYLPFITADPDLARLIEGVVRRQTRCILADPYANAFMPDLATREPLKWSKTDHTDMKPGVGERKWEVDSLCYPVRLAHEYWRLTRDTKPFGEEWARAMHTILETFTAQQRKTSRGPYHFQRKAETPYDTLSENGFGNPARPNGLIHSGFRPSDDSCIYPLNIPANFFAVKTLERMEEMLTEIAHDSAAASQASRLRTEIKSALDEHARANHPAAGEIWAYEIDGFGNALCMDDANVPSLLGMPYLETCSENDSTYLATRRFVLSEANPYFFRGTAAEGIGGPHIGQDMIWPMGIIIRALTTNDDKEQRQCLAWLKGTHAGTGFMHESFNKDNPAKFTRDWFAWANTLFGELILKLDKANPKLLEKS